MMKIFLQQLKYITMGGIGITALMVTGCASVPAPNEQIAISELAVANATSSGGDEFASAEMNTARDKLDRASKAMIDEDYESARLLAEEAEVDAQLATSMARSAKAQKAAAAVKEDIRILRKEIERQSR